mmetsp:Transcript_76037/g.217810  ORF Transcript_76037/g.217810 Transcript_76037/m.217810 type:complete len:209 (-) Transcript_76037:311-937(-)
MASKEVPPRFGPGVVGRRRPRPCCQRTAARKFGSHRRQGTRPGRHHRCRPRSAGRTRQGPSARGAVLGPSRAKRARRTSWASRLRPPRPRAHPWTPRPPPHRRTPGSARTSPRGPSATKRESCPSARARLPQQSLSPHERAVARRRARYLPVLQAACREVQFHRRASRSPNETCGTSCAAPRSHPSQRGCCRRARRKRPARKSGTQRC